MRITASFIVAVYNVESYLPACIGSLLRSDLTACEVLLIDDGSTDGGGRLCDVYAASHERISAYHKPNGGLSDARNFGVSKSKGEWIIFVDGDDSVNSGALSQFLRVLRNTDASVDIILNDYILNNSKTGKKTVTRQISQPCTMEKVLRARGAVWNAWRYAYRKSFITKNHMSFKTGWLAEDLDLTARVFQAPGLNIKFVHIPYYMYTCNRRGSITTTASLRFMECMTESVREHCKTLNGRADKASMLLRRKLVRDYVRHAAKYFQFNGMERKEIRRFYRADGSPLPFNVVPFAAVLYLMRRFYRFGK